MLTQELFVCAPRWLGACQGASPPGFQVWAPGHCGVRTHWGTLGLALRQLGRLSGLVLTQGFRCGPLDARQRASSEQGLLFQVHSPGAEGGGAPEAAAAAAAVESSLTSYYIPLFSFPF